MISNYSRNLLLQQYLPFTVLKPIVSLNTSLVIMLQQYLPFTVLKPAVIVNEGKEAWVATVLTVYGIETSLSRPVAGLYASLQQYLPFTVLKPNK